MASLVVPAVSKAVVRVGVGCFVTCADFPRKVLLGERMRSHGAGRLALPGGHLELGESWEACATREVLEETNIAIDNVKFVGVTNDPCIDGDDTKHYITVFMHGKIAMDSGELINMEPHKCKEWKWVDIDSLSAMSVTTPELLFLPMVHFFQNHDGSFINS